MQQSVQRLRERLQVLGADHLLRQLRQRHYLPHAVLHHRGHRRVEQVQRGRDLRLSELQRLRVPLLGHVVLDEAGQFVRELIDLEYQAQLSRYSETDDAFQPKLLRLNLCFADECTVASAISRAAGLTKERLAEYQWQVENLRRRRLVGVHEIDSRAVFACHVTGADEATIGEAERVWYVAKRAEGWRVVGIDRVCFECDGEGKFGERACWACGGPGWVHSDGENFARLPEPRR